MELTASEYIELLKERWSIDVVEKMKINAFIEVQVKPFKNELELVKKKFKYFSFVTDKWQFGYIWGVCQTSFADLETKPNFNFTDLLFYVFVSSNFIEKNANDLSALFNELKIISKMDKQDGKKITFENGIISGAKDVKFYKENKVFKSSLYEYLDDVFYKYKL
jgi:hypothetical protein